MTKLSFRVNLKYTFLSQDFLHKPWLQFWQYDPVVNKYHRIKFRSCNFVRYECDLITVTYVATTVYITGV